MKAKVLFMKNKKLIKIILAGLIMMGIIIAYPAVSDKLKNMSKDNTFKQPTYKAGKELTIFVATDIHYLAESLVDGGQAFKKYVEEGDGKQLNYIEEIMSAFMQDIKEKKPDVLILSGDLTNNGEAASHREMANKLTEIEKNGTLVYVIPGNHDIANPWARGFKENAQYRTAFIEAKDFSKIYQSFGYNEAVLRDQSTLSYLAAPSEEVWLLMLDTSQYNNNQVFGIPQADGQISSTTIEWIKKCISLAKEHNAQLIPVMHHNLLEHSEMIREGYTLNNNQEILELFVQNDMKLNLSGHIHIQDISSKGDVYDIVTSSLAVYPQQYGVLKYIPSKGAYDYHTSWVNVEGWAEAAGLKDENLRSFRTYSEDSFGKLAYQMADRHLSKQSGYSLEDRQQMAKVVQTLNLRYFAGVENLNAEDVLDTHAYRQWETVKEGFLKDYVKSISMDKDTEDNSLLIQVK